MLLRVAVSWSRSTLSRVIFKARGRQWVAALTSPKGGIKITVFPRPDQESSTLNSKAWTKYRVWLKNWTTKKMARRARRSTAPRGEYFAPLSCPHLPASSSRAAPRPPGRSGF